MKRIFFLLISLYFANSLFAETSHKEDTIQGKNTTYEIKKGSGKLKLFTFMRNMNNPDTTKREELSFELYRRYSAQWYDIEMQLAEIIHDCLSLKELDATEFRNTAVILAIRVDPERRKLIQIVNFATIHSFWENLSPDKLFKIEQAVLQRLELPHNLPKECLEKDFLISVVSEDIRDIEESKKNRQQAMEQWKEKMKRNSEEKRDSIL